ncbi:uncharacterized protein LOC110446681 isoform X9 [Mizuhopecten yessoensis]|uniref:uncharacterized protein LOC110446681 isoform X9 n=1 Tax=Mizuhopecten yessoensis TaxID=6573 RepID=UPI000B45E476|nr:uncharacterized protein LOC110446681 isoform X9 [Mizuhopecten yessoensis]
MAPKRKLDEEEEDASAGSAGEEKQEDEAASSTEADTPAKKGRGRPKKSDAEKKPYTPTGNPRGRPRTKVPGGGADTPKKRGRPSLSSKSGTDSNDVENSLSASPKKRGRPSLASKRGTDNDVNDEPTNQPRKRGRPLGSTKKQKGDKAQPPSKQSPNIPTGKPRGRGPLGENSAKISRYIPTGKPRGRRPLGENGRQKYVPTGIPRGRKPIGDKARVPYQPTGKPRGRPKADMTVTAIQVKKKYFKKEKYRLQVKPFKIRRAKFKPKPTEKKFMTVKPLKTEPPTKNRIVPVTVQLVQSHKDEKSGTPHVNLRNSGTPHLNLRNCGTPSVNPTIFNVTPSKGSNARYPMLNEYQRSLLHVNHSKHLLNYECDREPALDVLQKKLLAVNTQLIDTEEQRLELDKRIIIFKQRKIELERQLLNYRPQRRVLTRVEQIPVINMANDQQSGVEHGAKIQGWVSVADNLVKIPNCSPSLKNCERKPEVQTSGPLHSRARSSADDSKDVKKTKKVTSRSEKRGRGRPRKQE